MKVGIISVELKEGLSLREMEEFYSVSCKSITTMRRAQFGKIFKSGDVDPATSTISSPAAEGWQEEPRALPLPEPRPVVVASSPAPEGISEPVYIERRLKAHWDNLQNQTVMKKKKKKRRSPRQLQMDDYEGVDSRSPKRPWGEIVSSSLI
ncbi:hypothetical protein KQX54_004272 [Cotesia glomerata]|uniref:Uncharacterized protein n=1 Tax=Cotesia glomerata TaxID=32391 RepID=A0AAV7IKW5_COTGL|nr:hypothetical protein KQX54_004272 [Cotesia glomerata]